MVNYFLPPRKSTFSQKQSAKLNFVCFSDIYQSFRLVLASIQYAINKILLRGNSDIYIKKKSTFATQKFPSYNVGGYREFLYL